jgi:hypothetical protein
MQISPSEMAYMVFKHTIPDGFFEFKCNSHILKVFAMLDGTANLATISKKTALPLKTVSESISQLLNLKLVTATNEGGIYLDEHFLNFLQVQLSAAVGPIAEILIEDAIKDLGHHVESFPAFKSADLVEVLAKDIQREDKRIEFQQKMVARIKQG